MAWHSGLPPPYASGQHKMQLARISCLVCGAIKLQLTHPLNKRNYISPGLYPGGHRGRSHPRSPPLKKCVGRSLKLLDARKKCGPLSENSSPLLMPKAVYGPASHSLTKRKKLLSSRFREDVIYNKTHRNSQ